MVSERWADPERNNDVAYRVVSSSSLDFGLYITQLSRSAPICVAVYVLLTPDVCDTP